MDKSFGQELIASAKETLAYIHNEANTGDAVVHFPEEIDTRKIRRRLAMSQIDFANAFGFNIRTLQEWEQGRSLPTGAVRSYLMVINKEPEVVQKILT